MGFIHLFFVAFVIMQHVCFNAEPVDKRSLSLGLPALRLCLL
jgi:hypothetical protein